MEPEGASASTAAPPQETNVTNVVPITQPPQVVRDVPSKSAEESKHTDAVNKILQKAQALSWTLNHHEIGIEHFLLAMTLVPEAIDIVGSSRAEVVRAACLTALIEKPIGSDDPMDYVHPSIELGQLLSEATDIANRREPELRKLSLEDISGAISTCPEESRAPRTMGFLACDHTRMD